ncbi:MAG: alpha/beta fold hydrolase [Desulfobacterales bacterium]
MQKPFQPVFPLKHPVIQTVLASSRLRTVGRKAVLENAQKYIVTTREQVRLLGFLSPRPPGSCNGLVILLNGWEGNSDSAYMLSTADHLWHHGFSVFRLNYRDHGESHHLNPGLFYATLLDEVFEGVEQAAQMGGGIPVFLAGFSLGGNFVLRIARKCSTSPIPQLRHVMSISPALDPAKSTDAIDKHPLIRSYFLKKWKRSLRIKQRTFPDLYDFSEVLKENSLRVMTEVLIRRYTDYETAAHYFQSYTVYPEDVSGSPVPTTIITAQDDPIIPVADFQALNGNENIRLVIHANGGHNGFLENFRFNTWYEREMVRLFAAEE